MSTYTANCHREGQWWVVTVPELDQVTQVRRLNQVEESVRSLVGLFTSEVGAKADVNVVVELPNDLMTALREAQEARRAGEEMQRHGMEELARVARELSKGGLTVRDIGEVLGVSHQRAQQLISKAG